MISQRPTVSDQTISSIQTLHSAPSFSLYLHEYLNSLLLSAETISHAQLSNAQLPFERVDVWYSCKFSLDILGNDVDGQEGLDAVKAKAGEGGARFDTILVAYSDDAEISGLKGGQSFFSYNP